MKQTLHFLQVGIIPLFLFNSISKSFAQQKVPAKNISIEELLSANKIKIDIKEKIIFNGQCLPFDLENLTSDSLLISLQSGSKIISNDKNLQNIFILKSDLIYLAPHQKKINSGYIFYYESPENTLINGEGYKKDITPENWRKLAAVIDKNDFSIETIQAAIWCITDNHPVSSIYSEDMKNIQLLRRTVSEIQNNKPSWYSLSFHQDTTSLYPTSYKNIIGDIEFYVYSYTVITINVRNKEGQVMTTLIKESTVGPGKHIFNMNLPVNSWPKGEYIIYVYENYSKINSTKTFEL